MRNFFPVLIGYIFLFVPRGCVIFFVVLRGCQFPSSQVPNKCVGTKIWSKEINKRTCNQSYVMCRRAPLGSGHNLQHIWNRDLNNGKGISQRQSTQIISCLELCFRRSKIHVRDDPYGCVTTTANYVMAAAAHIICKGRWCNMPSCVVIVPLKHGVAIDSKRLKIDAAFGSRINFLK